MASSNSLFLLSSSFLILLLASQCHCHSSSLSLTPNFKLSTISASPALLPYPPQALPPDITPLFPTPAGSTLAPTESSSSLPTIPSSPSPPNPDSIVTSPDGNEHPHSSISPSGSTLPEAESSAFALNFQGSLCLVWSMVSIIGAFW